MRIGFRSGTDNLKSGTWIGDLYLELDLESGSGIWKMVSSAGFGALGSNAVHFLIAFFFRGPMKSVHMSR